MHKPGPKNAPSTSAPALEARRAIIIDPYTPRVYEVHYAPSEFDRMVEQYIHKDPSHEGRLDVPTMEGDNIVMADTRDTSIARAEPLYGNIHNPGRFFGYGIVVGPKLDDGTFDNPLSSLDKVRDNTAFSAVLAENVETPERHKTSDWALVVPRALQNHGYVVGMVMEGLIVLDSTLASAHTNVDTGTYLMFRVVRSVVEAGAKRVIERVVSEAMGHAADDNRTIN